MKHKKELFLGIFVFSVLALASIVSYSYATWFQDVEDTTINKVTTLSLKADIIEEYDPPEQMLPTESVEKIVNIKNTGNMDILVRVKIQKAWGATRDEDDNLIVDDTLSTDNILIEYDDTKWVYDNGYFYYKDILAAGEETEVPLFKSFTIDSKTGNEYQGMLADIIVYCEAIQANNNAISEIWNKTYESIEVETPVDNEIDYGPTKVTFIAPSKRFDIHTNKIDLFTNFKELIPGSTRSQIINVGNIYDKAQEISLKANPTPQAIGKEDLINRMLDEYIFIQISYEGDIIYDGPVSGNVRNENGSIQDMKDYIPLGVFEPNQFRDLVVSLTVDKTMGNEFQDLLGNIEWQFLTTFEATKLVVNHYIEGTKISLSPTERYVGGVGEEYLTTALKNPGNYTLVRVPGNAKGKLASDTTYVEYYYRLVKNPNTGDSITPYIIIFGISGGVILIGTIFYIVSKKKEKKGITS